MRLYRPHIPLEVKIKVAERQAASWPSLRYRLYMSVDWTNNKKMQLDVLLRILADRFECPKKDLHLDHDPPLAAREKWPIRFPKRSNQWAYNPDANDPDYLIYRSKQDHHIKTNVRGEHGQYPDRVLIKRHRRTTSGAKTRRQKQKWPKRKIANRKRPWAKRPFRSQKATQTVRRRRGRPACRVRHQLRHHEPTRA